MNYLFVCILGLMDIVLSLKKILQSFCRKASDNTFSDVGDGRTYSISVRLVFLVCLSQNVFRTLVLANLHLQCLYFPVTSPVMPCVFNLNKRLKCEKLLVWHRNVSFQLPFLNICQPEYSDSPEKSSNMREMLFNLNQETSVSRFHRVWWHYCLCMNENHTWRLFDGRRKALINPFAKLEDKDGAIRRSEGGKQSSLFDFLGGRVGCGFQPKAVFIWRRKKSHYSKYYQTQEVVISFSSLTKVVIPTAGNRQVGCYTFDQLFGAILRRQNRVTGAEKRCYLDWELYLFR